MISEIRLLNYKRFRCEKISLEPLTVFIGPNGAGKSTVASALYILGAIIRLGLRPAFPQGFFSFHNLRSYDADEFGYRFAPIGLGISGHIHACKFDYDIIFAEDTHSPSGYYINYEGLTIEDADFRCHYSTGAPPKQAFTLPTMGEGHWLNGFETHSQRDSLFSNVGQVRIEQGLYTRLKEIQRYMQRITKYQFSPSVARMGSSQYDGSGSQPFLKNDGANLAEVVQYLQEEQKGLFQQQFKKLIIEYAEGGSNIVDVGVSVYENKVFLNFYEEDKNRNTFEVRGPLLADGYWVFASFACLAACQAIPSIAFFEEPESYLHPHKLDVLFKIFEMLAMREKEPCQVLISSHSPYFLDFFKTRPNSIIFLNKGQHKRLTDIEDYERILSLYSFGEAWYSNAFNWGNP